MKRIGTILWCAVGVCVLVCATACSKSEQMGKGSYVKSYITSYTIPNSCEFYMTDYKGVPYVDVSINGKLANKAQVEELREKYNDLSYNKVQVIPEIALYDGIISLSAETVDYFNEEHPAGSDVSNIVICKYLTYYEFIQSGYEPIEKDYALYPPFGQSYDAGTLLHEMVLSEVNYDNSQLMDSEMSLEFISEPEEPGTYKFKFHLKMPEVEINTTFEYEFQ